MIDLQYSINIKSNVSDGEVLFNGVSKGYFPKNIPISLSQVQNDFGGTLDIRVQKTNYVPTTRYEITIIRNPAYDNASNLSGFSTNSFFNPEDLANLEQNNQPTYSNIPESVLFVNKYENELLVEYDQDFNNVLLELDFNLTALQSNNNQIYNDNTYEYETICLPFLKNLGQMIYDLELKRDKKIIPNFDKFLPYK
jgi:hypothetical protein